LATPQAVQAQMAPPQMALSLPALLAAWPLAPPVPQAALLGLVGA